jgi:hypothetical protein
MRVLLWTEMMDGIEPEVRDAVREVYSLGPEECVLEWPAEQQERIVWEREHLLPQRALLSHEASLSHFIWRKRCIGIGKHCPRER